MKTKLALLLLSSLLMVAARPGFAMLSIGNVSPERAKEMGIELRSQANGTNEVWVGLEFKPVGQLKGFDHVSLEITEGGRMVGGKFLLGWTALKEKRTTSGGISVGFLANRAFLDHVTLRIVTDMDAGYDLHVKDFVDLKKLNEPAH